MILSQLRVESSHTVPREYKIEGNSSPHSSGFTSTGQLPAFSSLPASIAMLSRTSILLATVSTVFGGAFSPSMKYAVLTNFQSPSTVASPVLRDKRRLMRRVALCSPCSMTSRPTCLMATPALTRLIPPSVWPFTTPLAFRTRRTSGTVSYPFRVLAGDKCDSTGADGSVFLFGSTELSFSANLGIADAFNLEAPFVQKHTNISVGDLCVPMHRQIILH